MLRRISGAFTGGVVGALIDSLAIWLLGRYGITAQLGIGLHPDFTLPWLYPRLVWGGAWGLLLLLPLLKGRTILRGILCSIGPSAMVLFYVFPGMGKGMLGLGFGTWTPALVIVLNCFWGIVASVWYRKS